MFKECTMDDMGHNIVVDSIHSWYHIAVNCLTREDIHFPFITIYYLVGSLELLVCICSHM